MRTFGMLVLVGVLGISFLFASPIHAQPNKTLSGAVSLIDASFTGTVLLLRGDDTEYWFPSRYAAETLQVGNRIQIRCGPTHCWEIRRGDELIYPDDTKAFYDLPPLQWVVELLAEQDSREQRPQSPDENPMEQIRRHCREEWPTDFAMQNWCQERQIEAYQKLR